jgi:hypothetical protein
MRTRFERATAGLTRQDRDVRSGWIVGVWIFWLVCACVLVLNHEAWRDELQAWAIVRSAPDPFEVLGRLRGEGHPPSWYLLLWPLAKISPSIIWLKVISLALGASSAWMILRNFPAPFIARVLLVFGYFPLFELTTISRSYGLVLFLVLLIMTLAERRTTPDWVLVVLIVLLAATHALALPIAAGIALALWGGRLVASPFWNRPTRWPLIVSGIFLVIVAVFVVWSAGDGLPASNVATFRWKMGQVLSAPIRAAMPLSRSLSDPWAPRVVTGNLYLGVLLAIVLLILVRRSVSARTLWAVAFPGFTFLAFVAARPMFPRFVSVLWVAALAAIWFAAVDRRERPPGDRSPIPLFVKVLVALVLLVSAAGGLVAVVAELSTPFSGSGEAADALASEIHGPAVILCAADEPWCSAVAIRLELLAYTRADGEPFTYVVWNELEKDLPADQLRAQAAELARRTGAEVFIVSSTTNAPEGCGENLYGRRPAASVSEDFRVCPASSLVGTQ